MVLNPPKIATKGFYAFSSSNRSTEQSIESFPLGDKGKWTNCDVRETEALLFVLGYRVTILVKTWVPLRVY